MNLVEFACQTTSNQVKKSVFHIQLSSTLLRVDTFRPNVIPGVSASTTKPVKPLPAGASGSVRAKRKYLDRFKNKKQKKTNEDPLTR